MWTQKTPWNRGVGCQGKLISEGKNRYIYIHTIGVGDFFPSPPPNFFSKFWTIQTRNPRIIDLSLKKNYKNCYPKSQTRFQYSKFEKLIKLKSYSLTRTGRGIVRDSLTSLFSPHPLLLYLRFFSQLFSEISENKNFFPGNIVIWFPSLSL